MNILKELKNNKVLLVIVKGDDFNSSSLGLIKKLKTKNKICYVSINKGYGSLVSVLKKKKVNINHYFFIDCITSTLVNPSYASNCIYVSSPRSLTEISLAIEKSISKGTEIIIIDSLSSLGIYHNSHDLAQFLNHLVQRVKLNINLSTLILISSKDKKSDILKQSEILVDKVIEIK